MNLLEPQYLAALFGFSELGLLIARRSRANARSVDHGSLRKLWLVILASIAVATACYLFVRGAELAWLSSAAPIGAALFTFGLILRWYSVYHLGRFFSVNVAVVADQHVVDTGPYRWVRHPSYSGLLLALLGLGICYGNWLALLLVLVPPLWVLMQRIRIEEAVLRGALGDAYLQYSANTKRLIPFIY